MRVFLSVYVWVLMTPDGVFHTPIQTPVWVLMTPDGVFQHVFLRVYLYGFTYTDLRVGFDYSM